MELNTFMKEILKRADQNEFDNSEIYLNKSENFEFRLYKGEVDYYEENEEYGVAFRGEYQDKMGYSYTERIDQSIIDTVLKNAKSNAEIMDEEEEEIFAGDKKYKELP